MHLYPPNFQGGRGVINNELVNMPGSIKGDVKRKHFPPAAWGVSFTGIQPPLAAATLFAGAWFSFPFPCEDFGAIFFRVVPCGFFCACKQRIGNCQPWFYLRLVAYGFFGLSEGAYGAP